MSKIDEAFMEGARASRENTAEIIAERDAEIERLRTQLDEATIILRDAARTRRSEAWGMVQMAAQAYLEGKDR